MTAATERPRPLFRAFPRDDLACRGCGAALPPGPATVAFIFADGSAECRACYAPAPPGDGAPEPAGDDRWRPAQGALF